MFSFFLSKSAPSNVSLNIFGIDSADLGLLH